MRCTGNVGQYLKFVRRIWKHPEQIYPDVNVILTESFLRLEANKLEARRITKIASEMLTSNTAIVGHRDCSAIAAIILLRFGDRRSLPKLRRSLEKRADQLTPATIRSMAIVYSSYGPEQFHIVRRMAGRLLRNHLAEIVLMVERIMKYSEVPGRYKARLNHHFDSAARREYLDMRSLVAARLLSLNRKSVVRVWLDQKKNELFKRPISNYDKRLLTRLLPKK